MINYLGFTSRGFHEIFLRSVQLLAQLLKRVVMQIPLLGSIISANFELILEEIHFAIVLAPE
jgi:hypothetical protein